MLCQLEPAQRGTSCRLAVGRKHATQADDSKFLTYRTTYARNAQASTNGARPLAPSNLTTGAAVSFSPYVRKKRSRVF